MNEAKELLSKLLIAFQNKTVWQDHHHCAGIADECKKFLRKPEPEPLGYMRDDGNGELEFSSHDDEAAFPAFPVYRESPARKPLSDDEINELVCDLHDKDIWTFARAVEKAHGIGGGNE